MLHQILGVVLLTTCTANFGGAFEQKTPQNEIKQPQITAKLANNDNSQYQENYTLYIDKILDEHTNPVGGYARTDKITYTGQNDFLRVYANSYQQTIKYNPRLDDLNQNDGTWAYIRNIDIPATENYWYSLDMVIMQITPYYANINTETNVDLYFNMNYTIDHDQYSAWGFPGGCLNQIYTTTDNLSQYIDLTTYGTAGMYQTIQQEFENANIGYQYTYTEIDNEWGPNSVPTGSTHHNNLEFNISVIPNETNYVIIFMMPYGNMQNGNGMAREVEFINVGVYGTIFIGYPDIWFNGTGIIPARTQEVVDIPGIMFQILAMPWFFISTAFNLTLFPGTPYQINVANLFIAIIAMAVFIFLMRLLLKGIR